MTWTVKNGVGIAPFDSLASAVPVGVQTKLQQIRAQVVAGTLVLYGLDVLGKVGAGQTYPLSQLQH